MLDKARKGAEKIHKKYAEKKCQNRKLKKQKKKEK